MLIALITGQRIGDIANIKFSDIKEEYLYIKQEKIGSKLAIPLNLKLHVINITRREAIAKCRDSVLSKWLIHYQHTTSHAKCGERVNANTLTTTFKKARDLSGLTWVTGTPPTFHEIRSLSERLYREQGIGTKALLGHKSQQQTDRYNDDRGREWLKISIN